MASCLQIIEKSGVAGVTTARVAELADSNKALITYYFGSKSGLIAEVAADVSRRVNDEFMDLVGRPSDAADLAGSLIDACLELARVERVLLRAYFDLASNAISDPSLRPILSATREDRRTLMTSLLGSVRGDHPSRRPDEVAVFLIAMLEGFALEYVQRGDPQPIAEVRPLFIRAAVDAMR
jgi:AcrR family transcriptional regulator